MLVSNEATEHFNRVKTLHNITVAEGNSVFCITLEVANAHATEVIALINAKLQEPFW